MARSNKAGGTLKPRPTTHKANAAGYAKRQSRKAKSRVLVGSNDVYEYEPEKTKRLREKVGLELGRDEAAEFGFGAGNDNDADAEDGRLRARLIGENGDNEEIGSDDDEEIDSDAAFEDSDEDRFAGFGFSSSTKNKKKQKPKKKEPSVRFAEVDLNEEEEEAYSGEEGRDEDEDLEGDPDEFIDILDVLDGKGEVDNASDDDVAATKPKALTRRPLSPDVRNESEGTDEEDEDENIEDEEEEKNDLSASDEDEYAPEALENLGNFLSTLDPGKKRKADDTDAPLADDAPRIRKRRVIQERTEAGAENPFAAGSSGSGKLNFDDLLAPLASQSSNLLSLKQPAKVLTSQSGSAKTLSAPLPQRTQERLDRVAAYEQTKEEVDKWSATMKRIKEAEHLSFPLQAPSTSRVSNSQLAAKFKPTTELETSIDRLLKSANLRDEDIQKTEELKMNHLSVEEVTERRAQLRQMRELMFRAEVKAKRVAKIKSKTYRRIQRKERQRLAEKLEGENGEHEDEEEARMKREVERARERATLRHKNTGKWAKAMKERGELDADQRKDITEMLDRGEQLRRKIRGERDDDGDESESGNDDDIDMGDVKASAFEELAKIKSTDEGLQTSGENSKSKSIFEMKFMKDAMVREQRRVDEIADDFIKEMGGAQADDSDADEGEKITSRQEADGIVVERTGGRLLYRPQAPSNDPTGKPIRSLASDTSSVTLKSTDLPQISPPPDSQSVQIIESGSLSQKSLQPSLPQEDNPWLIPLDEAVGSKAPRKENEVLVGKNSGMIEKSRNKLQKHGKKRDDEKQKAKDDAVLEISMDDVMKLGASNISTTLAPPSDPTGATTSAAPKMSQMLPREHIAANGKDESSDAGSEIEEQEKALDRKGKRKSNGVKAFEQRDLVARAFAGDNVVQSFEEVKKREIAADAPRTVDTTLAGWGSWGGAGTKKAPPKPFLLKKIAGIDPTSRSDHNKAHVIISEKRDKKAAKYIVKDLPYPYTSKAQYDRRMETPIGSEWNTRVGFQRATLPKVVKKMGVIIDPLEKLS